MLLIWGFKALYKVLSEGTFYCPREGGDRAYRRKQARKWFTFFWIPVIPLDVLGEFIECSQCGSTYDQKVLTLPTAAAMTDNLTNAMRYAIVSMISADGVTDQAEKGAALEVMKRYSTTYTNEDLDRDLATLDHKTLDDQLVQVAGTLNEHGKEELLSACLSIAAADGSLHESEIVDVVRAGAALGMSQAHVKGVISHFQEQVLDR